jgi:hypothetical protein
MADEEFLESLKKVEEVGRSSFVLLEQTPVCKMQKSFQIYQDFNEINASNLVPMLSLTHQ